MELKYRGALYTPSLAQEQRPATEARRLQFLGQVYNSASADSLPRRRKRDKRYSLQFLCHPYSLC